MRRLLLALAVALALAGCGGASPVSPSSVAPRPSQPSVTTVEPGPSRVVIISIDGLRPDAIVQIGAPNMMALAMSGAFSWRAQTVSPSTTLPSHTSMLTGVTPAAHGIVWDEYEPARGLLTVPTIFASARARGLRTAMVAGKAKFANFRDTGGWAVVAGGDAAVAERAVSEALNRPDLLFVHLPDVDLAGHSAMWMSPHYFAAVERADEAVGRIVAASGPGVTVIVTADHGGHHGNHTEGTPDDTTIPWIISGPRVSRGRQLSSAISTVDTAATVAYLLDVSLSSGATGRPVLEAFDAR